MEAMKIAGGSAPPTVGGLDASYPPEVVKTVRHLCEGMNCSEKILMDVAALWIKSAAEWKEMYKRRLEGQPLITDAEFAEKAKKSRHNDAAWFPNQYLFDNTITEERTCIWRQGSCSWTEKSCGIMWVAVHGADSICVVTKKGDLDRERLGANFFKLIPEEKVRAFFRKFIICQIEDNDLSTTLRQSLQESIKKPFGVVSADKGSVKKASSAVCYEEKAIEFLTEKMNHDTDFTVEGTIKTAVGAFQCLFPEKLKATEIEVSVMDPRYRVDDPWYRVGPVDEDTDVTVWEVPTEVYENYLDAVDKSGPRVTPSETQGGPPACSSNILLG